MPHLTKAEQETIVSMNSADEMASIWTAQRRVITRLRRNPFAEELESGHVGRTEWARFELPRNRVTFRGGKAPTIEIEEGEVA